MTKIIAGTIFIAISTLSFAQEVDVVQIFGQFVQASYASSKCSQPDQKTLSSFLKNFELISVRAAEELMKQNPNLSEQQVVENLKKGTEAVEKAIDEVLGSSGCSDPRIQDLVKRFEIQANLQF